MPFFALRGPTSEIMIHLNINGRSGAPNRGNREAVHNQSANSVNQFNITGANDIRESYICYAYNDGRSRKPLNETKTTFTLSQPRFWENNQHGRRSEERWTQFTDFLYFVHLQVSID